MTSERTKVAVRRPEEGGELVTSHKYDRRTTDAEDAPCVRCGFPREAHEETQA